MLIFICFVVVILKKRSDLKWLASVSLPACLDYALPQSTFLQLPGLFFVWYVGLLSVALFTEAESAECDLMVVCVVLARLFTFFVIA